MLFRDAVEAAGGSTEQQQHCDVKVEVHRKSSSASCDQALVAIDMLSHKLDRSNASCSSKNQVRIVLLLLLNIIMMIVI